MKRQEEKEERVATTKKMQKKQEVTLNIKGGEEKTAEATLRAKKAGQDKKK